MFFFFSLDLAIRAIERKEKSNKEKKISRQIKHK